MTRIGRVKAYFAADPATPCFRLVIEGGRAQLGCWRAVGFEDVPAPDGKPWLTPTLTVFERVS